VRSATVEPRPRFVATNNTSFTGNTEAQIFTGSLKVLTLNMAHGRKEGFNEYLTAGVHRNGCKCERNSWRVIVKKLAQHVNNVVFIRP
jgi:hypothetical protein